MIESNTITRNEIHGISLVESKENTIINNQISKNNLNGIDLDYSSHDNVITGNQIFDNKGKGIDLELSIDYNTIANNTIYGNEGDFKNSSIPIWTVIISVFTIGVMSIRRKKQK
ncbi:MAG: NosD domain-containing protein [Candidatus Hodarchaeales archaeon]|jgi:parallel beta-helix repeat protein